MSEYTIRFDPTLSNLFKDILIASDVYMYRFDMMTSKCTCFDKVEIRFPKFSKDCQAFVRIGNRTASSIVPETEGQVIIFGGYVRFWLREKDDAKAHDIIVEAVTDDANQHIDQLKHQIEMYESRLHKVLDIQIA